MSFSIAVYWSISLYSNSMGNSNWLLVEFFKVDWYLAISTKVAQEAVFRAPVIRG
jgi:hypothetical protein